MSRLAFPWFSSSKSGKTEVWWVCAGSPPDDDRLGEVRWFGRWRKYVFVPASGTLFDAGCLREIADFCDKQTKLHRKTVIGRG